MLWDGPLGKTVGGTHPDLFESIAVSAHASNTHFARSMRTAASKYEELPARILKQQQTNSRICHDIQESTTFTTGQDFLEWWRWDSIGAACDPRCGGCRCGDCQPGGKEMTLAEERELEVVRDGLTYVAGDCHSKDPHWHAKCPWIEEPVSLPQFMHLEEERRVLQQDSYVDDVLTSQNDLDRLRAITANVESILKAGGFQLKPWVFSEQSGRQDEPDNSARAKEGTLVLPNQMGDDDNKALGLGYIVGEDRLHVMTSINFSKRKQKMRLGQNLLQEQVRPQTPNPLTRRELLSQVAGLYDPSGLVTPAKQKGAILVRQAFQEAKNKSCPAKDTWDTALSEGLREDAIELFEQYVQLGKVKFTRALTPSCHTGKPWAVTFSDGSEHSYGAVMYLRWSSDQGPIIKLVESKAKLTPLDQKGDAVKSEVCGAVFASRLKRYFEKHSQIKVEKWFHLVDSQTVLGAIQRESYGYQTFFANRIGEIQSNSQVQDWWWIPGPQNIADLITRGSGPKQLDEDSEWQNGPEFLSLPVCEWPIKSAKEIATAARESINKLQKKAFVAALTRAQAMGPGRKGDHVQVDQQRPPAGSAIQSLVDIKRFSSLTRLVKTIAWIWRAARRFLGPNRIPNRPKWEVSFKLSLTLRWRPSQYVYRKDRVGGVESNCGFNFTLGFKKIH